jgi:hypothetical protein
MDFQPTINSIQDAARIFRQRASDLDKWADQLAQTKDWTIVGEVITCITSAFAGIRLDLLSTRPVRELQRDSSDTLNDAIERVSREIPKGWFIQIDMSNGYGGVNIEYPADHHCTFVENLGQDLSGQLLSALAYAKKNANVR